MERVSVEVQGDHLERLSSSRPLPAIAELVWNALDGEAREVNVHIARSGLGAVEEITVEDNGHGMTYEEALTAFGRLGGSWKLTSVRSRNNQRLLHGKEGKGRFRAFALGGRVQWTTVADQNGRQIKTIITGDRDSLGTFDVDGPHDATGEPTGTVVKIVATQGRLGTLLSDRATTTLTGTLALYLRQYPDVDVLYDGIRLDPTELIISIATYALELDELQDFAEAELTVIEWTLPVDRALYLCDMHGFALAEISPGIQAPGFEFTAYIRSAIFESIEPGIFDMGLVDLSPELQPILDAARKQLRRHFRARTAEAATDLVEEWKRQEIYPYEGEAVDVVEKTEREVFDIVALSVNSFLPNFPSADAASKKLALRLLRQGIEHDPGALNTILNEVLDLPQDRREELAELLKRTSLGSIINASKIVADRLDFLRGLEVLVFDPESKQQLLERSQLQRMLVPNTWVFGEEFTLSVDDQSLTEVLRKHLHLMGRADLAAEVSDEVLREDGSRGIVDLMLSRSMPQPRPGQREHLVVELKRPKVKIAVPELNQIESYAIAVSEDERFRNTNTHWSFWIVSNELGETAKRRSNQGGRPSGLLYISEDPDVKIWVRSWGQIIEDCRARLRFFQERLEYSTDREQAIDYLRRTHERYLPPALAEPPEEE